MTRVTLNDKQYDIHPVSVGRGLQLLKLTVHYLNKCGVIIRVFTDRNSEQTETEKFLRVMNELSETIDGDDLERDLVLLVHLLSEIPSEEISTIPLDELFDALPAIIEASRFAEVVKRAARMTGLMTVATDVQTPDLTVDPDPAPAPIPASPVAPQASRNGDGTTSLQVPSTEELLERIG